MTDTEFNDGILTAAGEVTAGLAESNGSFCHVYDLTSFAANGHATQPIIVSNSVGRHFDVILLPTLSATVMGCVVRVPTHDNIVCQHIVSPHRRSLF